MHGLRQEHKVKSGELQDSTSNALKNLKDELASQNEKMESLQKTLKEKDSEASQAPEKADGELKRLQRKCDQTKKQNDELKEAQKGDRKKMTACEAQLSQANTELERLQQQVQTFDETLEAERTNIENRLDDFWTEIWDLNLAQLELYEFLESQEPLRHIVGDRVSRAAHGDGITTSKAIAVLHAEVRQYRDDCIASAWRWISSVSRCMPT